MRIAEAFELGRDIFGGLLQGVPSSRRPAFHQRQSTSRRPK
jgi:hypothetical protein